jgi:hypothetical protein
MEAPYPIALLDAGKMEIYLLVAEAPENIRKRASYHVAGKATEAMITLPRCFSLPLLCVVSLILWLNP